MKEKEEKKKREKEGLVRHRGGCFLALRGGTSDFITSTLKSGTVMFPVITDRLSIAYPVWRNQFFSSIASYSQMASSGRVFLRIVRFITLEG